VFLFFPRPTTNPLPGLPCSCGEKGVSDLHTFHCHGTSTIVDKVLIVQCKKSGFEGRGAVCAKYSVSLILLQPRYLHACHCFAVLYSGGERKIRTSRCTQCTQSKQQQSPLTVSSPSLPLPARLLFSAATVEGPVLSSLSLRHSFSSVSPAFDVHGNLARLRIRERLCDSLSDLLLSGLR
jgi:hypothetical protein